MNIDIPSGPDADMAGKTYQWTESGSYFTGLEVFHSLHCLVCINTHTHPSITRRDAELNMQNRLRQALYPDYYQSVRHAGDKPWDEHIG